MTPTHPTVEELRDRLLRADACESYVLSDIAVKALALATAQAEELAKYRTALQDAVRLVDPSNDHGRCGCYRCKHVIDWIALLKQEERKA